jgi:hypothetical protein
LKRQFLKIGAVFHLSWGLSVTIGHEFLRG